MTGAELHQLLLNKWGKSFDIQLRQTKGKIYVQVMWKYLEQASFPLSRDQYFENLNAVANYLNAWNNASFVEAYIHQTKSRPRLGKAVSIPLELGDLASEWILGDL